jgi:ornithine cyclodeaminase
VADRLSQCARFGEISHAIAAGFVSESHVCQLGEIVAGRKPGRTRPDEITVCDLTGVGFQDTAIAALAWARVRGDAVQEKGPA